MAARKNTTKVFDAPGVGTQGVESGDQPAGVFNVIRTDLGGAQMLMYRPTDGADFEPMLPKEDRPREFVWQSPDDPDAVQTFNLDTQTARVTKWAKADVVAKAAPAELEHQDSGDTATHNPPA